MGGIFLQENEYVAHRPPGRATVYPQVWIILQKHRVMELIAQSPKYTGLFGDKRLEKRGLQYSAD